MVDELPTPTPREQEILAVLWEHGPSSVRAVHERLAPSDGETLAYNTVQTLLRLMEMKRLVVHQAEGRTFIYRPVFTREESATRFLDRVFGGEPSQLVQCLIDAERVSADELDRLRELIADARRKRTR